MVRVEDYMELMGDEVLAEIYQKATPLHGIDVVHINSTYYGGGVAEMLKTLVPLMNDLGIDAGWRVLHGTPDFFTITKGLHNSLQGEGFEMNPERLDIYEKTNGDFSVYTHLDHDMVVIHDPQPLPLVKYYKKHQPWLWRCHIDLSDPNWGLWDYIKRFILRFDGVVVSNDGYKNKNLPVNQMVVYPAIDPLSKKNREMKDSDIDAHMERMNIPRDKPLITQISRFDKWKDPIGVIDVFKKVKERMDCRLVLCGSMASDDPEGYKIYDMVKKSGEKLIDSGDIIIQVNESEFGINALQRASSVIIQKSIKEGFGLTATEGLWKGTPVVASNIGGFPIQIENGKHGFLIEPENNKGFADAVVKILKNEKDAKKMGEAARENVRQKFLVTRLLLDYMNIYMDHLNINGL